MSISPTQSRSFFSADEFPLSELLKLIGCAHAPLIIDVRREARYLEEPRIIAGAIRIKPEDLVAATLPKRPILVYCVHGHEVSANAAQALRGHGFEAAYLEGGIHAWHEAKGATLLQSIPNALQGGTQWVTRERPKIDRIACPWLIQRFIDPLAVFHYVPSAQVIEFASQHGAIAYDVPNVQFTHRGDQCSFDALITDFAIQDPALQLLATIVRGADTDQLDIAPECAGLLAISLGLSANIPNDHAMLAQGMVMYDALYRWCTNKVAKQVEQHNWTFPS
jgi:rhodanese-related sulfurtransferase